jgi:hypothetical protein
MIKIKLIIIIIIFCIILTNCEELEEYVTNVRGKVYADSCKVVIAVKGESNLFSYMDDVSGIDEQSLREPELFRGFDLSVGNDSLYNITMLSFGETYFLAVVDDGSTVDVLDSLDHVGFYGESDTIDIPLPGGGDTTFIYSTPASINVQERIDENDVDIRNFVEYRWFIIIYQLINQ